MSEEILKALMQLFAIIVKQDVGVHEREIAYVQDFLLQQLDEITARDYLSLFKEYAGIEEDKALTSLGKKLRVVLPTGEEKRSPSVKDSVRIFSICKKINKTLTLKQKVVVLLRLFELLNSDEKFTPQRMNIVNTVAEVFNISEEEYNDIELYVRSKDVSTVDIQNVLAITGSSLSLEKAKVWDSYTFTGQVIFLKIRSADLYFLKHSCDEDIFLNGMPVYKNRIYLMPTGASLHLPHGNRVYYSDIARGFVSAQTVKPIAFRAENLSYQFPNGNAGLDSISFSEEQGKLVGIMGISGAGKTTLLNVLSGIQQPSQGKVTINGFDIYKDHEKLEGVTGYVPQDDLLIEELTVFQNLYYNAKLCFGHLNRKEIEKKVNLLLEELDLLPIRDLQVGSTKKTIISGGQRKRLNIALELIREPSVLFVDEPTSGLSSRDSENVMDLLRALTLKGKLIFIVIHQPSSDIFKLFDNVLILDTGGRLVYYGNPIEAVIYFKKKEAQINSNVGECPTCGNVNPEIIFDILDARVVDEFGHYTKKRKISSEKWAGMFKNLQIQEYDTSQKEIPEVQLFRPGKVIQYLIYLSRDFVAKISNRQYVLMSLLEAPVLAFILTFIIRYIADPESDVYIFRENENIPVYIFMALIVGLFLGLTISAEEIFKDRKILQRERFLHLSRSSYLLAKISTLFFISAIQGAFFVLIGNTILGIRGMFFAYWLAWFTTAASANLLGLIISSTLNSVITIYITVPLLIIPMMVLSGAMFPFDKLNRKISSIDKVPLVAEMMPTRWTYEALMVHQFKDNRFEKYFYAYEKQESQADFQLVYRIPKLRETLNRIIDLYKKDSLDVSHSAELQLLSNEIIRGNHNNETIKYDMEQPITTDNFTAERADSISTYLNRLEHYYSDRLHNANQRKQEVIRYMLQKDEKLFKKLRDNYLNEHLSDLVKKVFEKNRVVIYKNRIIQKYHPIYKNPENKHWPGIRSHFFAPVKNLGPWEIDTYWFNIVMVWLMNIFAYIFLYFDLFSRVELYIRKMLGRQL